MIINFGSVFKKDFIKAKQAGFTNKRLLILLPISPIAVKKLILDQKNIYVSHLLLRGSFMNLGVVL